MLNGRHWATRARLVSGIVLYVYVATHLINHAFGVHSLEAMEAGRAVFLAIWRNPVGTTLLYGAFATHVVLVLWALYRRRSLRMPLREALQIAFGLLLPIVLLEHAIGTRLLHEIAAVNDTYGYVLVNLWVLKPSSGALQATMLLLAWAHGSMGLYFWLRLKPWFARVAPWLFTAVILLPTVALIGFVDGARELARMLDDDAFVAQLRDAVNFPDEAAVATAAAVLFWSRIGYGASIGLVLVGRGVRWLALRRSPMVTVSYADGRKVTVERGTSVLEASRRANIPHASVCGGRGRCSTCRVHVSEGRERLPPPSADEARVLRRVGASEATRLACQLRPTHDATVSPLLPPDAGARDARRSSALAHGAEREVAILFADIRAFTTFSEHKLPYDVVFVLNQYFRTMGTAVERSGGQLDKFIGDGVMALFGVSGDAAAGCRAALQAAHAMALGLKDMNEHLRHDLPEPLRIGIGIHVGPVILGDMGYARVRSLTAIGDAVNTASRLEAMTKDYGAQLVVSARVAERAGLGMAAFRKESVDVRGRKAALEIYVVEDATRLPVTVEA